MAPWQPDIVGGAFLADGTETKIVTGVDDHSRYCVITAVLSVTPRCPRGDSPGTYMPAITGELVLGGSGDRAGGSLDQVDDDRMRGAAGVECRR